MHILYKRGLRSPRTIVFPKSQMRSWTVCIALRAEVGLFIRGCCHELVDLCSGVLVYLCVLCTCLSSAAALTKREVYTVYWCTMCTLCTGVHCALVYILVLCVSGVSCVLV